VTENPKDVTDKDIDEQVDNIRWRLANLEEASAGAAVEKNDHVSASVTLQVGDEPPVVRHDLELAARGQAIEGVMFEKLDEVLIGAKVGETKTTEATVGDEHATESWRGKTAKATIEVAKVSKWILPEVNDALTQQFGVESVEKWREILKAELESRKGQQVKRDMEDQVREYLLEQVKFDLPEKMTERQTDRALIRRIFQLQQMGMPQVLIEEKIDDLRSRSREAAVKDLKLSFIMEKIARQMEIEVSDEEVNSMIANVALSQGRRPERVRQEMLRDGRYENAFGVVREQKVLEKLLATAKITKSEGEKADSKKKKK
jgi:trigger factor